ncbi:MAG: chromosome segregation protein SMC [Clostridia bacterium]|nr:chromosome segregation protein SMC [Clostridia bacterium]
MKFKRIEVYGFKSFADKHEIPFGAGITGIVGPNGCGKSNVADAIRWVLGEQSAKLLRGHSMQDVIFNGTEKRKSMSYCEVALVFDNREKLFPSLDYDEVVILRKLYRSGESEYALNRTACRLKDIVELLRDGGMGREGYSIIGQGRIDELLSAKPEDRRNIFEEAAGISKFKARKVDAERKLGRTRDNLTRIIDILEEKNKQLEPLRRQAETAKKWLDYRDSLRHHEINTYIHQYETAASAKEIISTRLQGIVEAIELKETAYNNAVASYNEAMYDLSSIDKTLKALNEELLTLTVTLEQQAGDMKVLSERVSSFNDANNRLYTENETLTTQIATADTNLSNARLQLQKKKAEYEKSIEVAEEIKNKYLAISQLISQGESDAQTNKQALLDAMDRLADIKANMSRLLAERSALAQAVEDMESRISSQSAEIERDKADLDKIVSDLTSISSAKTEFAEELQSAYAQNNELLALANETTAKLDKLNEKFYTANSRRKILAEMQQGYEGFAFSVKNLMNDAKTNPEVARRIEGVVGKIISMDAKFETAVETALGQATQNMVTKNEDDAKYLIAYLKQKRYGRMTFLPMTSIKPRYIDSRYMSSIKSTAGCFGVASDLVKFDSKFKNIIEGLLGGTVIVDNLDTAVSLARSTGYGFKIVTLDGDVINPSGSLTGGSKKDNITNIFSHERELKELESLVKSLTAQIEDCTNKREDCAQKLEKIAEKIKLLQQKIHDADVEIATKTEAKNKLVADIDEMSRVVAELESDCEKDKKRAQKIDADINSVSELESLIQTKKQTAKEDEESVQIKYDELKAERDALQEKMMTARVAVTNAENDIKTLEADIERYTVEISSLKEKIAVNNEQIAQNKANIDTIHRAIESAKNSDTDADAKRAKEVRGKIEHLDEFKSELNEKVATVDKNRIDLMNELQNLRESKTREEMLLLKVDSDIEQMEIRVREEYNLEYADCLPYREEGYDFEAGVKETARLKRAMNALGNVNVDAIEMSKTVAEEYEVLDTQRQDLEKAEADLLKIIKEMSDEMLSRFTGKFEQIRTNFKKIFKELFNGGTADLVLMDSENPLEAGIEIVAQPPEKKLQSISLLSGGEKALTAIAILFAILRLKPMPFCLLDEIEAALDDANANRFAKYLRRFSEDTQFIVITHRKPTMELADSLYGVTMEEKGVSKIVSVKLEEDVKNFDND